MPSATASILSMSSDSLLTGPRHSVGPALTPTPMVTNRRSSGCIAATASTKKWIAARSLASTKLSSMSDWPTTRCCDRCSTTTLLGRRRQRWPATINLLMTCPPASASHIGHGTDCNHHRPELAVRLAKGDGVALGGSRVSPVPCAPCDCSRARPSASRSGSTIQAGKRSASSLATAGSNKAAAWALWPSRKRICPSRPASR
jgi:hypothetical protein